MAKEIIHNEMHVIEISGKEAADFIGLIAAQLAGVALSGNASGAAPTINIVEHGVIKYRLVFCIER